MSTARRRARHARQKAQRDTRRGSFYTGGPKNTDASKAERTKQSKVRDPDARRPLRLPLVVKPSGQWGYRFGKFRKNLR